MRAAYHSGSLAERAGGGGGGGGEGEGDTSVMQSYYCKFINALRFFDVQWTRYSQ